MRMLVQTIAGLSLIGALPVVAQQFAGPVGDPSGTPVDRGVADISANSASLRVAQPGIGQFGVGSLLLDRHATSPFEPTRFNPFVSDPRTNHRYVMQAPGVTALMNQTNYIGPSPRGGWTRNGQIFDGAEIMTYSADTIFVLSPDLLQAPSRVEQEPVQDHPNRVQPISIQNSLPMQGPINRQASRTPFRTNLNAHLSPELARQLARNPNYVHPEIVERRRKLKAEREAEAEAEEAAKKQAEPAEKEAESESETTKTNSDSASKSDSDTSEN